MLASGLLRAHVGCRTEEGAGHCAVPGYDRRLGLVLSRGIRHKRFGQSEVQNLDPSFRRDFDVGRLQVTVNDAFLMSGFEGLCDLLSKA